MPQENFRIRIRKDGTIYLAAGELGQERLRQLREMVEDCLGPVRETLSEDDDGGPAVRMVDKKDTHLEQKS